MQRPIIRFEKHHIKPDSPFFAEVIFCFRLKTLSNLALDEPQKRFFEGGPAMFICAQLDARLKATHKSLGLIPALRIWP